MEILCHDPKFEFVIDIIIEFYPIIRKLLILALVNFKILYKKYKIISMSKYMLSFKASQKLEYSIILEMNR